MNKKILLSLLIIGVVASAAGAGTWAYFSDTETSTDNTLTAGTLVLSPLDEDSWDFSVDGDIAPGDSGSSSITVENDGILDGYLYATLSIEGDLATALDIEVTDGTYTYDATTSFEDMKFGLLSAAESKSITVSYTFDQFADNAYQGDSATFTLDVELNQLDQAQPMPVEPTP